MSSSKVILITGASKGIGLATANHLASLGHTVFGSSRTPANVDQKGFNFELLPMDVCSAESVNACIEQIKQKVGRLDVVVNNAGRGMMGAIEDSSPEEAQKVFDTNVLGILNVCRGVLPIMRDQKSGLIVNISSIAGLMGLPYRGIYSASKYAVEGLTESMRYEVKPFGINVCLVEPGDIKTDISESRVISEQAQQATSPYKASFDHSIELANQDVDKGSDPLLIAKTIVKVMKLKTPAVRYVAGALIQELSVSVKNVIPSKSFEKIIKKYYKL